MMGRSNPVARTAALLRQGADKPRQNAVQQPERKPIVGDTLKITLAQTSGEIGELSTTDLTYPASMPNDMANLFNVEATLSLALVALRAAIVKASMDANPSPGVVDRMKEIYNALNAVINPKI
jgi:hypothetical protein